MPKALHCDAREIVLKVMGFMEAESIGDTPIIPFNQVYKRVSVATGESILNSLYFTQHLFHLTCFISRCKHGFAYQT